jgi:hypothetical protein
MEKINEDYFDPQWAPDLPPSLILSSLCGIGVDVIGRRVVWDGAKSSKMLSSLRFFSVEPFTKYFVSR